MKKIPAKRAAPSQLALVGAKCKRTTHLSVPLTSRIVLDSRKKVNGDLSPVLQDEKGPQKSGLPEPPEEKQAPDRFLSKMATVGSSWFAMLVALIYGSGFLCVFTYLNHFGIRGTGGDLFRARFVHVGILFLLFPISVLVPLAVTLSLRRIYEKLRNEAPACGVGVKPQPNEPAEPGSVKRRLPSIHITSYLLFLNMGWVFYICLLFTPRDFLLSSGKEFVVPLIFMTSLLGPGLIQSFVGRYIVPHRSETFSDVLHWATFVLIVAPLDYWAFSGFFHELWSILWGTKGIMPAGALYYFAFTGMFPYLFWRTNARCKQITNQRGRTETRIAAACLSLMFYFLSVHSFAVRVFPYIPVAKGGGDYTEALLVDVSLRGVGPLSHGVWLEVGPPR